MGMPLCFLKHQTDHTFPLFSHKCSINTENNWKVRAKIRTFAKSSYNKKRFMDLPKDPMMLFSVINMKLRDQYDSLDALCKGMDIDREDLVKQLAVAGFEYSEKYNKFW